MEGASSIHMVRYPREEKFFQIQGCPSTGLAVFLARRASGNSYSAKPKQERQRKLQSVEKMKNKAVYTTAPVAGGWAGAVMSWAGAKMISAGA